MSTTHNNRYASRDRLLRELLNLTHMLLLIALASGLILVVPASAQSTEAPNTTTGSVLGTVVDSNNDTIPNATEVLQKPNADPLTVVTKDDEVPIRLRRSDPSSCFRPRGCVGWRPTGT